MSSSNLCSYCNKFFSTKGNLQRHQKIDKHCLILQGKQNKQQQYVCEYCEYNTGLKYNLNKHLKICKKKNEYEEKQKEHEEKMKEDEQKRIRKLEDELLITKTKMEMLYTRTDRLIDNNNTSMFPIGYYHKNLYPNIPVIYLIEDPCDPHHRLTYGRTKSLQRRAYEYYLYFKCVAPIVHHYIPMNNKKTKDIESLLHDVFSKYRVPKKSEWIIGISVEEAIIKINSTIESYEKNKIDNDLELYKKETERKFLQLVIKIFSLLQHYLNYDLINLIITYIKPKTS